MRGSAAVELPPGEAMVALLSAGGRERAEAWNAGRISNRSKAAKFRRQVKGLVKRKYGVGRRSGSAAQGMMPRRPNPMTTTTTTSKGDTSNELTTVTF